MLIRKGKTISHEAKKIYRHSVREESEFIVAIVGTGQEVFVPFDSVKVDPPPPPTK